MNYRRMPGDNRDLSVLGFGVMRLPTRAGLIDKRKSDALLFEALEAGVNYFDTAHPYLGGQSEPYLGRFLEENGLRNDTAIATKLPHWQTKNEDEMERMLNKQLKRLRTEYADYYLIHNITGGSWKDLTHRGVLDFMRSAKASGRVRRMGFSWHGLPEDFPGVVDAYDWDFCQIQYNILDEHRQAGVAGLEYASSKGLGLVIMEPLRGGKLAARIPPKVAELWKEIPESSPATWLLRWIWNRPEVNVILSGFSKAAHLKDTLKAADSSLPQMLSNHELAVIEKIKNAYKSANAIGCTSCRYCLPCPFGVSIPEVFDWYNEWKTMGLGMSQRLFYLSTVGGILSGKSGLASQCTSCGACLSKCPQSLPIPKLLMDVSREYEGRLGRMVEGLGKIRRRQRSRKNRKT